MRHLSVSLVPNLGNDAIPPKWFNSLDTNSNLGLFRDYGLHRFFYRNKTFLFFQDRKLKFVGSVWKRFQETSQYFNSFKSFRQFLFPFFLSVYLCTRNDFFRILKKTSFQLLSTRNIYEIWLWRIGFCLSIGNWALCSRMLLYLHHRNSKLFFHPAKFDIFKDEKISDYKTASVPESKNLLD